MSYILYILVFASAVSCLACARLLATAVWHKGNCASSTRWMSQAIPSVILLYLLGSILGLAPRQDGGLVTLIILNFMLSAIVLLGWLRYRFDC